MADVYFRSLVTIFVENFITIRMFAIVASLKLFQKGFNNRNSLTNIQNSLIWVKLRKKGKVRIFQRTPEDNISY